MIKLRNVKETDLDRIYSIETEVYPVPWSYPFFNMMSKLDETMFIVATEEEEIIGYCVGEIKRMGSIEIPLLTGHVMNVAVTGSHQKKGVGTILMDEIERIFIEGGADVAYLEVRESNTRAQSMYRKRGYRYVRTSKAYYGDEDGYIMMKNLTR